MFEMCLSDSDETVVEVEFTSGEKAVIIGCYGKFQTIKGAEKQLDDGFGCDEYEYKFRYGNGVYIFKVTYDIGNYWFDRDEEIEVCIEDPHYDFDFASFTGFDEDNDNGGLELNV